MRLGKLKVVGPWPCYMIVILLGAIAWTPVRAEGPLVINEILYHVRESEVKEDRAAEFVELYHAGDAAISLEGWAFTSGIRYRFPRVTVEPGSFLVVAADVETFRERHPEVAMVFGPFQGRLSNSGERLKLEDADGDTADELTYADSGRWARRVSVRPNGYDDWIWEAPHDGEGASLSLISPSANNAHGEFWKPSEQSGGTPGGPNDTLTDVLPPVVTELTHDPIIPTSRQEVTVRASVEHDRAVSMRLHYRRDGSARFEAIPMRDGKGLLPAMPNGTVIQYVVEVTDDRGVSTTYPLVQRDDQSGAWAKRQATCLYQVDDAHDLKVEQGPGRKPLYRFISTAAELAMLRQLNGISGRNATYNNHLHGALIIVDGVEQTVKQHVSARIRGHGSRSAFPPGLRINFPSDDRLDGIADLNLNSQYTHSQSLGAALHQVLGVASAARSTPIHLRMNGEDWTRRGAPQFGCYVRNEVLDSDYVDAHFPGEEDGNLYRLVGNAYLNEQQTDSNFRSEYNKRNHATEDDYSDIVRLIETLRETEPAETYFDRVNTIMDIEQWARYIAVDALLCNTEGGMPTGRGDDVALFCPKGGRFQLIPYDLDSILGMGDAEQGIQKSVFDYGNMAGLRALFQNPQFLQLFTEQIVDLTDTVYKPEILNRVIDDLWQDWIPEQEKAKVKRFLERRREVVLSQIKGNTMIGSTLDREKGFYRASSTTFALYGRFDRSSIAEVTVGGMAPQLFQDTGTWIMVSDQLGSVIRPGMNQLPVVMRDTRGNVVQQELMRVWLDNGAVKKVAGELVAKGEERVWKADEGPYLIEGGVAIPAGGTLRIEPGVTVYGRDDSVLSVSGTLRVEGREGERVTFARDPSAEDVKGWNGLRIQGDGQVLLRHGDFLDLAGPITFSGRRLIIDGCSLHWQKAEGIRLTEGNLIVRDSALNQRGADDQPVIDQAGGALTLMRSSIHREGRGAAVRSTGEPYLFGNVFEQRFAPVLSLYKGYVDGNDFRFTGKVAQPAVESGAQVMLTRNRLQGAGLFMQPDPQGGGNERVLGEMKDRSLAVADIRFVQQSPQRTAASTHRFTVAGHGLVGFRYRLDDHAWSEWTSISKDQETFEVTAGPGKHTVSVLGKHVSGRQMEPAEAVQSRPFEVIPDLPPVVLSEVLAINRTAYESKRNAWDYVELRNFSSKAVELAGYALSDDPEDLRAFVFSEKAVIGGDSYFLQSLTPDTSGFALNGDGDEIIFSDPNGKIIDRVRFGLQLPDLSISQSDEGEWSLSEATPGFENRMKALAEVPQLSISEWYAAPGRHVAEEFIELHNASPGAVDIGGYTLTDRVTNPKVWRSLPPLSYLAKDAYTVFYTDGETDRGAKHLDFRQANEGEVIGLMDPQGRLVDHAVYGTQAAGYAQRRGTDGRLTYERPSPGAAEPASMNDTALAVLEGIRITEIHYHPAEDEDEEFIELTNVSARSLPLQGVAFTNGIEFVFGDLTLHRGERVVVVRDRSAFQQRYGSDVAIAGAYEGKLSNKGEKIELVTATGEKMVEFEYSDGWHRKTDGGGYSLAIADVENPRLGARGAWRESAEIGGSPGR